MRWSVPLPGPRLLWAWSAVTADSDRSGAAGSCIPMATAVHRVPATALLQRFSSLPYPSDGQEKVSPIVPEGNARPSQVVTQSEGKERERYLKVMIGFISVPSEPIFTSFYSDSDSLTHAGQSTFPLQFSHL